MATVATPATILVKADAGRYSAEEEPSTTMCCSGAIFGAVELPPKSAQQLPGTRLRKELSYENEEWDEETATPSSTEDSSSESVSSNSDDNAKVLTSPSSHAADMEMRDIAFCTDQFDWLAELAQRHSLSSVSEALERLIDASNREPPKTKRMIFLMVRCRRCLQHSRGGDKKDFAVELAAEKWEWLHGVRNRCGHATVGKTLRIIVDFYWPLMDEDASFERALLGVATVGDV